MRYLTITILRRDCSPFPNDPGPFAEGAAGDGALFAVNEPVTWCEVNRALTQWSDDVVLLDFWRDRRQGFFRVIDGDSPAAGESLAFAVEPCGSRCQCKGSFVYTKA